MNLRLLLMAGGLLLAPLLGRPAAAQALDPTFTPPTGVYALGQVYGMGPQQADGKRLVTGNFSRVNGATVPRLVRLDANGALDAPFTLNLGTVGYVDRIRRFPSGQYLLGGYGGPVTAGGLTRRELLRLNADGTADASFNPGTGPNSPGGFGYTIDYATQADGKVVAVGNFSTFNGAPAPGVVRLNADGSVDSGFAVGTGVAYDPNGAETAFAVAVQPDGKVLVGGTFETFNGLVAHALVRLNANGSVDPTFASPLPAMQQVEAIVLQPDGKILVSGNLPGVQPAGAGIIRLLPTGVLDTGFTPPAFTNGTVSTGLLDYPMQLQPDGKIVVVGYFSAPNPNMVARLNANGTHDTSFQFSSPVSGSLLTVGLQPNGAVLVGGFISGGTADSPLVQVSGTGAPDPSFNATMQVPGLVQALVRQPDGKLVLGGNFTEISGQRVQYLARLSANGGLDPSFQAAPGSVQSQVISLAQQADGKILAGAGSTLLRFDTNGLPDPGFAPFPGYFLARSLAVQPDGRILVGGSFTYFAGGQQRMGVVRLTSSGNLDPTFARDATSTVLGTPGNADAVLLQPDGRILVGGQFRSALDGTVCRLVRYDANGALDPTFNDQLTFTSLTPGLNPQMRIHSLALQPDGKVLVGGRFSQVSGASQAGVARLSPTGFPEAGFAPSLSSNAIVYSLTRQPNGRILLGGTFAYSAPTRAVANLARLLDTGQDDTSFATITPNGSVRVVQVAPTGTIVVAGGFSELGSQPAFGVARLTAPNVLAVAAPAAVASRTGAWPVPAHGLLHVAPDAGAQPQTLELLDALGRSVRRQPATAAATQTLDLQQLPAGTYLLRVSYAAGAVTRRIVVE